MKRVLIQASVLLILVAALVAACGPQPTRTPPAEPPADGVIYGEALVEDVEIQILESFPVQVHAVVRGHLPDGCTTIETISQQRTEDVFRVTIVTARPADAACTQALVPFEETIALDVVGLEAGTYRVNVNSVTERFELAVDNVPQEP